MTATAWVWLPDYVYGDEPQSRVLNQSMCHLISMANPSVTMCGKPVSKKSQRISDKDSIMMGRCSDCLGPT